MIKLFNLLICLGLAFSPIKQDYDAKTIGNPIVEQSTTSLSKPFNYIGYGDYSTILNNYTIFNVYDEVSVDYLYVDDASLSYTYMIYPLLFYSDSVEFSTIFVNFFAYDMANYLTDSGNIFELGIYAIDTFPFTSWSNTLNWFKTIDNLSFDYYLSYDSVYLNGLINGDCIYSYLSLDSPYINEGLSCCVMRFNRDYYWDFLADSDYLSSNSYLYPFNPSYFTSVFTSFYNPQITFSELDINGSYAQGFQDGVNSVDTESIYNDGVNYGASQVDTQHYYDTGYQIGYAEGLTHSTHSYGIVELGYAIFNMPILVLSNLLSFTIFGQEFWGLIVSFLFLGLILWLVKLFIKGGSSN